MAPESAFKLTKWYFDGAAADGRAFIAYWASLAWRFFSVTWQDVHVFEADGTLVHRSSIAGEPGPTWNGDTICWQSDALGGRIEVTPRVPRVEVPLLETPHGSVAWRVEAPAAMVTAAFTGSAPIQAPGYAECIVMTLAPWHLPIRELRWGRWLSTSADRSLVWVDWRGPEPRTWVLDDGALATRRGVTDDTVTAGDAQLVIGTRRTLHERSMADVVAPIAPLRAALPASILALRQSKWCSQAVRRDAAGNETPGRAIHELVVFR